MTLLCETTLPWGLKPLEDFRSSPDLKCDVYTTQSHDLVNSPTGLTAALVFIVQAPKKNELARLVRLRMLSSNAYRLWSESSAYLPGERCRTEGHEFCTKFIHSNMATSCEHISLNALSVGGFLTSEDQVWSRLYFLIDYKSSFILWPNLNSQMHTFNLKETDWAWLKTAVATGQETWRD